MKKSGEVIVIGCGVSGLTCGIRLLENGFRVRIMADSFTPNTTSDIAPAYWSPFRVYPEGRVLEWGKFSYKEFLKLSKVTGTGVSIRELMELYDHTDAELWWEKAIPQYRRADPHELPPGFLDGYYIMIPLVETPLYMRYLIERFSGLGGGIQKLNTKISSISQLLRDNSIIVNSSGLGARELCDDREVYPIRGQIVRIANPGISRCYHYESSNNHVTYIVPRSDDCVLGGTVEENDWDLDIREETANRIIYECQAIEPSIKQARVLEHQVGLRPGRKEVRLEIERISENCAVIHNYGHGGAGFTLSWGCAEEVLRLASEFMRNC